VQAVAASNLALLQQTASLNRVIAAEDLIATKQNAITAEAPLSESLVDGLTSALAGKQATIADGDLQISAVSGLQAAIDGAGSNVDGISDVPGLQSALNLKANASTAYTRTHIDANFQTLASAAGHATAVTTQFTQVTDDFLAINQELSARAYSADVHSRTEVNTLLAAKQDSLSSATVQVGDHDLLNGNVVRNIAQANNGGISIITTADRISLSAETALATKVNVANAGTVYMNPTGLNSVVAMMNGRFDTVEAGVATKQTILVDLGPSDSLGYVSLKDGDQLRRIIGDGDVVVSAANAQLGGGVVSSSEHVEAGLSSAFTNRVSVLETDHAAQ